MLPIIELQVSRPSVSAALGVEIPGSGGDLRFLVDTLDHDIGDVRASAAIFDENLHQPPLFAVVVGLHGEVTDPLAEAYLLGIGHPVAVPGGMGLRQGAGRHQQCEARDSRQFHSVGS